MAEYGIATYDANGNYNNYGIKPVSVVGIMTVPANTTSMSQSFNIPSGFKVGFVIAAIDAGSSGEGVIRVVRASGNTITVIPFSGSEYGSAVRGEMKVLVFLENA